MYWLTGGLGFLLIVAPNLFGYTDNSVAFWTSGILGFLTLAVSVIEWVRRGSEKWEYWVAGFAGIVAILAPFVLGFQAAAAALWMSITVGVLLTILAGTKLFTNEGRYI